MADETKKIEQMQGDVWSNVESKEYAVSVKLDKTILSTVKLKDGENLIGRMPENDIMIDDPEVSRSHARLMLDISSGNISIEDMQSENGVIVNGNKVARKDIKVGDKVLIGNHLLELTIADSFISSTSLEEQIQKAGAQQWRLDQTIAAQAPMAKEAITAVTNVAKQNNIYGTAVVNEEEQKKIVERIKKPKESFETNKINPGNNLQITFNTDIGAVVKNIEFDYVRTVDPKREKNLEDAIYINVKIGQKIFCKKIRL